MNEWPEKLISFLSYIDKVSNRELEAVFLGLGTGVTLFCKELFYFTTLACFQANEEALVLGSPGFEAQFLH